MRYEPQVLGPMVSMIGFFLTLGSAPGGSLGATLRVPAEYPTIQAGIDAAMTGDVVLVASGTYTSYQTRGTHTSCVFLKDGVVLRSESGAEATTIDGALLVGPQPSVVEAAGIASFTTQLEGFTITNQGRQFEGLVLFGTLTVSDCVFRDLDLLGVSSGAGIAANGNLKLYGCLFDHCYGNSGGAIYHANGTIEMHDCVIRNCGNIGIRLDASAGLPVESALVEGCLFEDNGDDGALSIDYGNGSGATVRNCVFLRNLEDGIGGGALELAGHTPKLVENCLFVGNESTGDNGAGGAIKVSYPATIRNNTFWGNAAYTDVGGSAIRFIDGGPGYSLLNNVIAAGIGVGGAIEDQFESAVSSCNVFWQNEGGDGVYFVPGPTDREVDPLFCDPDAEDFTVRSDSPCLPEYSLGCGLIGAFEQGCGSISVEPNSWGTIKSAYRNPEEDGQ